MMDIGKNIRMLRELRGLTQKELARASGLTLTALSRLERGDQFSTNKLSEIAKALNTRVSDIDPRLKEDLARLEGPWTNIPKRLTQARARAGYNTATIAAEALGVAYGTYSGPENGLRGIKGHDLHRYAQFFKVTSEWLQFGRGTIEDFGAENAEGSGVKEPARQKKVGAGDALGERIETIRVDKSLAGSGEETGASAQAVNQWENGVTTLPLSDPTGSARERVGRDLSPSRSHHFLLEDEIVATFDGVLDGCGFPAEKRNKLAQVFASALAEPVQLPAGRDRAMARRAIASALVCSLKLFEQR